MTLWNIARVVCFFLLAFHLGWSLWLLALIVVAVELIFDP